MARKRTITQRLAAIQFSKKDIDQFINGYLECALWASPGMDSGAELDSKYQLTDLTHKSLDDIITHCDEWFKTNEALLVKASEEQPERDFAHHGHDLFLTQNRHGCGFWDRGYSQELSDALTKAAKDAKPRMLLPEGRFLHFERG